MMMNQRGVLNVLKDWVAGKDIRVIKQPMTADELKAAFAALPPMDSVESEHTWKFWAWDLRQNVKDKNPAEFLTWPVVNISMFVGNAPYIDLEYAALPYRYIKAIHEPKFGKPPLWNDKITLQTPVLTSGNLVHQAYHLLQTDTCLPELDTIIEIGGGYGAMALICHRLGFQGRYIIYDLPEFSLLQQYYLSNVGVDNVEFRTQITKPIDCDLLIGLYSLSEMPWETRERILDLCPAESYLIAYMPRWGEWDNMAWASDMMKRKGYNWQNWNVNHLPSCWYLAGDKRE